jgi:hypothetical protein
VQSTPHRQKIPFPFLMAGTCIATRFEPHLHLPGLPETKSHLQLAWQVSNVINLGFVSRDNPSDCGEHEKETDNDEKGFFH